MMKSVKDLDAQAISPAYTVAGFVMLKTNTQLADFTATRKSLYTFRLNC